jgi:hypothetical protein
MDSIRGPLRGHNDTPFGWPTPGRPIHFPEVGHPQGVFGIFSYYQLVVLFLNIVCLTVAMAYLFRPIICVMQRGGHGLPKISPGPALPFYALRTGNPRNGLSELARPQGGRPAAVSYPFGRPSPYAYVSIKYLFRPILGSTLTDVFVSLETTVSRNWFIFVLK